MMIISEYCVMKLFFFLQDLSNKDMKRDLYIVSQVIRTGKPPVCVSKSAVV